MTNFKTKLGQFVDHQIDLSELEQALRAAIAEHPEQADNYIAALQQLVSQQIIDAKVFARLNEVVDTTAHPAAVAIAIPLKNESLPPTPSTKPVQPQSGVFPALLKAYQAHEVGYRALEKGLLEDLSVLPDKPQSYINALNHLIAKGVIAKPVFDDLMAAIDEYLSQLPVDAVTNEPVIDEPVTDEPVEVTQPLEAEQPIDDADQTRITKLPVENTDQTQIKSKPNTKSLDQTSRTSQTSATSTTNTTSTLSTWSKPFELSGVETQVGIGTELKGRFKITEFIGKGGMGDVFKAEDLMNVEAGDAETEIAVKVLNKEFRDHQDSLISLQREAKKTRQLGHPHIVKVYDFDRDQHNVFMTMELMVGDPLNKAIRKHPDGFPLDEVYKYVAEMGDALQYAHRRGVIHCDFKPGNIFLSAGEIKVFDFGIARAAKSGLTAGEKQDHFDAGDIGALTPSYASPEMLEDSHGPEPQDDIYALGCIVYELLTGAHPFLLDGKKVPANEAMKQGLKPQRIGQLKSWQWDALKGCLEFSRGARTAQVSQFTNEFLLFEKPISGKVKAVTAAVLLSLGLAGYVGWEYKRQTDVQDFVALIKSNRHDEIKQRLKNLVEADASERQQYFAEIEVETELAKYVTKQVADLSKQDDFQKASEIIALANRIYGDVNQVIAFNKARDIRVAQLDGELVRLLASEQFVENYRRLKEIWDTLRRVQKDNSKLSDTSTAGHLTDYIQQLISDSNYIGANELADFSLALLADNPVFAGYIVDIQRLKTNMSTRIDKDQRNKEITALEDKLVDFDKASTLADYEGELATISELNNKAPENAVVLSVLSEFNAKLERLLQTQIGDVQWDAAYASINRFELLLSRAERNNYSEQVAAAKLKFDEISDGLVRELTILSRSATPDQADAQLQKLINHRASIAVVEAAKDTIALGWLKQAKKESAQQNWSNARAAIQSGLFIATSDTVKNELTEAQSGLSLAQQSAANQGDTSQQRLEKNQAITGLEKQFRQVIQVSAMTVDQAGTALKLIDDLEVLDPTNGLIDSGKAKIVELLQVSVTNLASTDLDGALALSNQAYNLLPGEEALGALVDEIKKRVDVDKASQKQAQRVALKADIERLMLAENFHENADELDKLVKAYQLGEKDTIYSKGIRSKIAQQFITYAETLKDQQRFDEADTATTSAVRFDNTLSTIELMKQQITTARVDYDKNKEIERQQARSESLKQSFNVQIKAQDFTSAEATLKILKAQGGNDAFVNNEAAKALLSALNIAVNQATAEDDLVGAIVLIEKQAQYAADATEPKQKLALYTTAQRIKDMAVTDVANAEVLLAQALQKYPNESLIKAFEQQLGVVSAAVPAVTDTTYFPSEKPCNIGMAGRGKSTSQTCYDQLSAKSKGPRLVVLPKFNGVHFAITRYEITVSDYNKYCKESKACEAITGISKAMPVTNLALADMKAYGDWLSKITGSVYQLPSDEQWQFAVNGKTNSTTQSYKNCKAYANGSLVRGDEMQKVNFNAKESRNGWGLTHYLGNASEVVKSGERWLAAGGSWNDGIKNCTADFKQDFDGKPNEYTGFRLVRVM